MIRIKLPLSKVLALVKPEHGYVFTARDQVTEVTHRFAPLTLSTFVVQYPMLAEHVELHTDVHAYILYCKENKLNPGDAVVLLDYVQRTKI